MQNRFSRNPIVSSKTATLFGAVSADVRHHHIALPHLSLTDLKHLTEASSDLHAGFYKSLAIHKHAQILLHAAMNGSTEEVFTLIEEAKAAYGNQVWQLFVTPSVGTEKHCGRKWSMPVSLIQFAAWSGNLSGKTYTVSHMPPDNYELEPDVLYARVNKDDDGIPSTLTYKVINPHNECVSGEIQLSDINIDPNKIVDLTRIESHLPHILNITHQRGHTNFEGNPEQEAVFNTYLLNKLLSLIPVNYYPTVIEQLQKCQSEACEHGAPLSKYNLLISEYIKQYTQIEKLEDYSDDDSSEEEQESICLDNRWKHQVGEAQKQLPLFGLNCLTQHIGWPIQPGLTMAAPSSDSVVKLGGIRKHPLTSLIGCLGDCLAIQHFNQVGSPASATTTSPNYDQVVYQHLALDFFTKRKNTQLGMLTCKLIAAHKLFELQQQEQATITRRRR